MGQRKKGYAQDLQPGMPFIAAVLDFQNVSGPILKESHNLNASRTELPVSIENWQTCENSLGEKVMARIDEVKLLIQKEINEECRLLECYTVWRLQEPTFRRNLEPPSSGSQESVN
jgi:hypothetical protein